ncbi:MAG: PhnD/SsuA/transferrin family substrate-binding protein [Rhodospirillales bacterium]|nr:PhnD/SsuA/transferrin family substrate-binding protein [Rhodospirillales bacterium]
MTAETRLASLPMYCEDEVRPATERWWAGLARHLRDQGVRDVPDTLTWPDDYHGHWRAPGLLFSQTCGYPLVHLIGPAVKLIATPSYDAPGCESSRYAAHVIVRESAEAESIGDLRGCRLAVNGMTSYSGCHVWRNILPAADDVQSFFGEIVASGSHRASIRLIAAGEADACAVDCVTHALLSDQAADELRGTRILTSSPTAPAMPYVTAAATSDDEIAKIRAGLNAAIADPSLAPARRELRLTGASVLTDEDYRNAFQD